MVDDVESVLSVCVVCVREREMVVCVMWLCEM